jgi:carboxypeptidase C (cathepsin A)
LINGGATAHSGSQEASREHAHTVSIDGRRIDDTATAGTILLGAENRRPIVSMFYVTYAAEGVREALERVVTEERGHEQ